MSEKLKPCPFCGGEAGYAREGTGRVSCQVSCTNCGAHHESGDSDWSNGSSWNRRPEEVRLTHELQLSGFYQQELADTIIAAGFRHPEDPALFNYDFSAASERAKAKLAAALEARK